VTILRPIQENFVTQINLINVNWFEVQAFDGNLRPMTYNLFYSLLRSESIFINKNASVVLCILGQLQSMPYDAFAILGK
jgi:hypothetical protein